MSQTIPPPTRGATLIEVIVALLLLECAGALALTAALTVGRTQHQLQNTAAFDLARLDSVAREAADSTCRNASRPHLSTITLPAGYGRPAFTARIRCGH